MSTDTKTAQLIINKLSKEQYESIETPSETELYFTPDTTEQDIADAVSEHNQSTGAHATLFNAKQDLLTAGTNISIINNVVGTSAATVVFKEWRS